MAKWTSIHRYARISPRKARLVTQLIAGRPVDDALDLLKFTRKRASVLIDKVLRAAMADADEKEANVRGLFVHEARVDPGRLSSGFSRRTAVGRMQS